MSRSDWIQLLSNELGQRKSQDMQSTAIGFAGLALIVAGIGGVSIDADSSSSVIVFCSYCLIILGMFAIYRIYHQFSLLSKRKIKSLRALLNKVINDENVDFSEILDEYNKIVGR